MEHAVRLSTGSFIHGDGEVTHTLAGGVLDSVADSRCHADYSQFVHRFSTWSSSLQARYAQYTR